MARHATIIDGVVDYWDDSWDVREWRRNEVPGAPDVAMGWPAGYPRGRGGSGGPHAIITAEVYKYLTDHRLDRGNIKLPVSGTTVKRLRKLCGYNYYNDSAMWWLDRLDDLMSMTYSAFGAKHGKGATTAGVQYRVLLGRRIREPGWQMSEPARSLLTSTLPRSYVAEKLDISVGSVGRLRWQLRKIK